MTGKKILAQTDWIVANRMPGPIEIDMINVMRDLNQRISDIERAQEARYLPCRMPQDAPEAPDGVIVAPDWEKLAKTQANAIDEACYWLVRGNPQEALTLLEGLEE